MFRWLGNLFSRSSPRAPGRLIRARYDAARTTDDNRRHWANADGLAANDANSPDVRRTLRNRSRYEVANNSYAKGLLITLANDVVGTGPRLQLLTEDGKANRLIETRFAKWARAVRLAEKLRVMRQSRTGDGEAFAIMTTNPRLPTPVKLDLRLVEADQVATPDLNPLMTNAVDGIVFDEFGNPAEYHVLKRHPGSLTGSRFLQGFDRIPAESMLHWYRMDRPGQSRGVPEITPALPLFAQLRRYTLATVGAAETAAEFAAFLHTNAPPNGEADAAEPFELLEITQKTLTTLPAGWDVSQLRAEQPATGYAEFKRELLIEIARCVLVQRGRDFEVLCCELFECWDRLIRRPYHTSDNRSEQVDGAIHVDTRFALFEAKWVKSDLAASDLFAFLGKVDGKFTGTMGVFISRNELTPNFLQALRAGRRQTIMVIHGADIDHLFDPAFPLLDYIKSHLVCVSTDNVCHLSTKDFLATAKANTVQKQAPAVGDDPITVRIRRCVKEPNAGNLVHEFADQLNADQQPEAITRLLNNYAEITSIRATPDKWAGDNLERFLRELISRLPAVLSPVDTLFFMEKLSPNFEGRVYGPLAELFSVRYQYLVVADKNACEERLRRQWEPAIGDYMRENHMAEPTRAVWDQLQQPIKDVLIPYFVDFVLSDRRAHYPQHRLADYALRQANALQAARAAFDARARRSARFSLEDEDPGQLRIDRAVNSLTWALSSMKQYLLDYDQRIAAAVAQTDQELQN